MPWGCFITGHHCHCTQPWGRVAVTGDSIETVGPGRGGWLRLEKPHCVDPVVKLWHVITREWLCVFLFMSRLPGVISSLLKFWALEPGPWPLCLYFFTLLNGLLQGTSMCLAGVGILLGPRLYCLL